MHVAQLCDEVVFEMHRGGWFYLLSVNWHK